MVFVFGYLWACCEAILPFVWLEGCAPNNGRKYTLLGSTYFVRAAVTCVMTSLKLFSLDWFSPFNSLSACVAEVELYQRGEPIYVFFSEL